MQIFGVQGYKQKLELQKLNVDIADVLQKMKECKKAELESKNKINALIAEIRVKQTSLPLLGSVVDSVSQQIDQLHKPVLSDELKVLRGNAARLAIFFPFFALMNLLISVKCAAIETFKRILKRSKAK